MKQHLKKIMPARKTASDRGPVEEKTGKIVGASRPHHDHHEAGSLASKTDINEEFHA
jgi:hypothetical protein